MAKPASEKSDGRVKRSTIMTKGEWTLRASVSWHRPMKGGEMRTVWLNEPRRSTTRLKYEDAQDQDHEIVLLFTNDAKENEESYRLHSPVVAGRNGGSSQPLRVLRGFVVFVQERSQVSPVAG